MSVPDFMPVHLEDPLDIWVIKSQNLLEAHIKDHLMINIWAQGTKLQINVIIYFLHIWSQHG